MASAWKCYGCGRLRAFVSPGNVFCQCGTGGAVTVTVPQSELDANVSRTAEDERQKLREAVKAGDPRLNEADIARASDMAEAWEGMLPFNVVAQLASVFTNRREQERANVMAEVDARCAPILAKLEEVRGKLDEYARVIAAKEQPFPWVG